MKSVIVKTLPLTLALACGGSSAAVQDDIDTPPEPPVSTVAEPEARPAEGVVEMTPSCADDADERCDAVDQDCDGRVDEGCGYDPGVLQITLAWNTDADIDLVVTDPTGATLTSSSPESPSGGALDREARGACNEPTRDRIENARWPHTAPSGTYRVELHQVSACDGPPTPTTATVTISARGRVLAVYNTTLTNTPRTPVATITLP